MKKIFLLGLMGLMGLMGNQTQAQLGGYGVKAGIGVATIDDDLSSSSPILGACIGGYVNYTFAKSQSVLEETFFLQSGLNLVRKGGNFEEILENGASLMHREGFFHAYYLQLPILACVHYELPIRSKGHVAGLYIGPTVNFGLFGAYNDRRITPGIASHSANYDVQVNGSDEDRQLFNHMNRLDIGLTFGLSYEYRGITASFYIDRGFMATSEGDDILRIIENAQTSENVNVKIPNGNNISYMLSLSYELGKVGK
jgi:hypothetical protein